MHEVERRPRKSRRVMAAFLYGPLVAAGVLALLVGVLGILLARAAGDVGKVVAATFVAASMFGYLAAGVLGVPGYWLFRRSGWIQRRHRLLLGGVVGGASGAFLSVAAVVFVMKTKSSSIGMIIVGSLLTVVAALCMGLVFRWLLPSGAREIEEIAARFD